MRRILFVDDDTRVLDGLRRMLRGLRSEWDMHFADRGQEALDLLDGAEHPFDVVVTDMRMPGMDGATLLKHVQERHPGTVRLILSGYAELELSMRSATCAHQFLTKPCDSEAIKAVVTRSLGLHERLADERLRDLVGRLRSLPALPATFAALNAAMADEEVTIQDVADVVGGDSAITAKVLQLVNSSFFGAPRAVGALRDAVAYLGLANIRTLVLQYGLIHEFDASQAAPSFCIEEHQRHALEVANLARRMHSEDRKMSEQAFLAGVLHDIGRLILATNLPDLFERVERLSGVGRIPTSELERRAIGLSHGDVGAYLLGIWGMPDPIVEAALHHHEPHLLGAGAVFDAPAAVHVADALLEEVAAPGSPPRLHPEFLKQMGLEDRWSAWRELAAEVRSGRTDATEAA
jgi:HD-like signal output (HDOD) protein